jgi:CheY-like chemotaxis protein
LSKEVLIVEDDRALASALERAISSEGYPVRVVHDGVAALEEIKRSKPGLVLLDLLIPKLDGASVLRKLRGREDTKELPVLVMTGVLRGRDHQREMERAGAQAFIEKPFRKSDLAPHLRRHLGRPGPKPGEIELAGSADVYPLAETPAAELIWTAMEEGLTGAIIVEAGKRRKTLVFDQGRPVKIRSNVVRECLGQRLHASGRIDARALDESLRRSRAGEGRQGQVLVKMGAVNESEVEAALREQAAEKLFELFAWTEGHAQIQRELEQVSLATELPEWSPRELILRGVRFMSPRQVEQLLGPFWDEPVVAGPSELDQAATSVTGVSVLLQRVGEHPRVGAAAVENAALLWGLRLVGALRFGKNDAGPGRRTSEGAEEAGSEALRQLAERIDSMDYFEMLGVPRDATETQIRTAFVRLAKQYHPDRVTDSADRELAKDVFARIAAAHEALSNRQTRQQYLEALERGGGGEGPQVGQIVTAEVQFQTGEQHFRKREYDKALEHLGWAIQLNAEEGEFQALYGWTWYLVYHGEDEAEAKARAHLEKGLQLAPQSANTHYYLGLFRKACGDAAGAVTMFRKAVDCDPKHNEANRELRVLTMRLDKSGGDGKGGGLFGFGRKKG